MNTLPNTRLARKYKDVIIDHKKNPGQSHVYYIACKECNSKILLKNLNRIGDSLCRFCRRCIGILHGVRIFSKRIWDIRDQIAGVRKTKAGAFVYLLKCSAENCSGTLLMRKRRKDQDLIPLCLSCGGKNRRKRPYEAAYNTLKNRKHKRRGIVDTNGRYDVSLSYEQFYKICSIKNCHYCRKELKRAEYIANVPLGLSPASLIDRKDNNIGYAPGNCVPCCPECNNKKGAKLTYEEMMVLSAFNRGEIAFDIQPFHPPEDSF